MFSSTISDKRSRCPHCRARASVHGTVEIMPGVHYRTLRCIFCAHVFDDEVPANPALATALAARIECGA
jgi:hypothetical protein